jgi:hydrogenase expression/formation protein HypC
MCMSIPARVLSVDKEHATIETETHRIRVGRMIVPELDVGDWVLVNAGQIVSRLTPEEAEATHELLRELRSFERSELFESKNPLA